uniref:Uncharacterized protein n=1 Tax=Peronospora matthiolae TaxID=2874970 RepID=A0AAV1TIB9_9STRA
MRDSGCRRGQAQTRAQDHGRQSIVHQGTKNPVNHGRANHVNIKYHHIRDEVKRGDDALEYSETAMMMADIMTKGLPGPRHR